MDKRSHALLTLLILIVGAWVTSGWAALILSAGACLVVLLLMDVGALRWLPGKDLPPTGDIRWRLTREGFWWLLERNHHVEGYSRRRFLTHSGAVQFYVREALRHG